MEIKKHILTHEEELDLHEKYLLRTPKTRKQELLDYIDTYIIEFENYLRVSETVVSEAKGNSILAVGSRGHKTCVVLKEELINFIKNQFNSDLIGHFGSDNNIVRIDGWEIVLFDQVHGHLTPKEQRESILNDQK